MIADTKKDMTNSNLKQPKKLSEVTSKLTGALSSKLLQQSKKVESIA